MNAVVITPVWPEKTSSAAGIRITQTLNTIRLMGYQVHVVSPALPNDFQRALEDQKISTAQYEPNDSSFDAFIRNLSPEIVVFDRFVMEEQFGWRVAHTAPHALRVLDTCDLHSLRRARQSKALQGGAPLALTRTELSSEDALREVAAIFRSDLTLVVSDFEMRLLLSHYGVPSSLVSIHRLYYTPIQSPPSFSERRNFSFIGNFNHPPNLDAYLTLRDHVWDQIRTRLARYGESKAEIHIYGSYFPLHLLGDDDRARGFRIKGWAEDSLQTLASYRVNLAPLRFGAGIKGKIAEGWAAGTPSATTEIGSEGMIERYPFGGVVAPLGELFFEGAASLYTDQEQWESAQARGLQVLHELYCKDKEEQKLRRAIETALQQLNHRREENFVGRMLNHHAHRSTEYMSRWIELKNHQK